MADDKKPWEDESLKGEYYKEKAKMKKPPVAPSPKPPQLPTATDAWGQAAKFKRRNKKIAEATAPLRKGIPGQD